MHKVFCLVDNNVVGKDREARDLLTMLSRCYPSSECHAKVSLPDIQPIAEPTTVEAANHPVLQVQVVQAADPYKNYKNRSVGYRNASSMDFVNLTGRPIGSMNYKNPGKVGDQLDVGTMARVCFLAIRCWNAVVLLWKDR